MTSEEKREYPRLNLGIEDGYFGNFQLIDNNTIVAPITNLSAGGLNMAVSEEHQQKINNGDVLLLKHIAGGVSLLFLSHIKTAIRWIKKGDASGYLSVGCRFEEVDDAVRRQIIHFVDSERITRGQYD